MLVFAWVSVLCECMCMYHVIRKKMLIHIMEHMYNM
jgi:hypothetical protein